MKHSLRSRAVTLFVSGAIAAFVVSPCGAANPAGFGGSFDEVVRLAHKEGKMRYGSSIRPDESRLVLEGFEKAYPKIKIEYTSDVEGPVSERVLSEATGGLVEFDMMNVPSALQGSFRKAGVLAGPLDWRNIFPKVPSEHFSPDGHFAVVSFIPRVIAYNPALVPPERVPKTWQACLDPYWKGRFIVRTSPSSFIGLWPSWGEEKIIRYMKQLKDNQPVWGRAGNTESALQVTTGEALMVCGIHYTTIFNVLRRDPKAKIAAVFPSETPIGMGETLGIMKGSKNPNAALLLAGWLASLDGQKAYEKIGRASPFIEGTEIRKTLQKAGVKVVFGGWNEEEHARERERKIVSAWGFR